MGDLTAETIETMAVALEPKCRAFTGGANQLAMNVARELAQTAASAFAASPPSPTLPSREEIARVLCEARGQDPDFDYDPRGVSGPAGEEPRWKLNLPEADRILALFTPPEPAPKPSLATVEVVEWK